MVNERVRERLPALEKVNKKKLKAEVKRANQVLEKMDTDEIANTNDLIYAGAVVVTEELGLRGTKGSRHIQKSQCGSEDWSPKSKV